jgi:orotate phosphoribosyltransferase
MLFSKKNLILHSGKKSDFKIECNELTDTDIECLAYLIAKKYKFMDVYGIPKGGNLLAEKLRPYGGTGSKRITLIVDDVLTTGESMEEAKKKYQIRGTTVVGVVIFARGKCPKWVHPIFQFWD